MSTAETVLINSALHKVGAKRILSATEAVGSAGIAADVLDAERQDLLRCSNWNFATFRKELAPLSTDPTFGFEHAFALPDDCLRVISVHADEAGRGHLPYKMESIRHEGEYLPAILADPDRVFLRYVRNAAEIARFSPDFRHCLILRLAKIFAVAIVKSNSLAEQCDRELDRAMRRSRSVDGIEDNIDQVPPGSWVTSRYGPSW
jgi:hypothetical protein